MPVQPTYPGVYVQEVPSGVRTIVGVSTSVTAFVGTAKRGPINKPITIYNYGDYEKRFGGLSADSEMSYAVRSFFLNGGSQAIVVRLAKNATFAKRTLPSEQPLNVLDVTAVDAGSAGNNIDVLVDFNTATPSATFNMTVRYRSSLNPSDNRVEVFSNLSNNSLHSRFAPLVINGVSELVTVAQNSGALGAAFAFGNTTGPYISDTAPNPGNYASLVDATHNQFQIAINGADPVTITIPGPYTYADLTTLAAAITGAGFTCNAVASSPTGSKRLVIASSTSGQNSRIEILPSPTNDCAVRLGLGPANGGTQFDAAAIIRPAITPLGAAWKGSVIAALTSTAGTLTLSLDGGISQTIDCTSYTISGATLQEKGTSVATRIQSDVRALKPGTFAYDNFTCVFNTNQFILTSGTRGAGSMINVSVSGAGVSAWGLTPPFTVTTPTDSYLSGGTESTFTDAQAYGVYTTSRANRTGIFALESVDLFNILCLPGIPNGATERAGILAEADAYCRERRAFMIVDCSRNDDLPTEMSLTITGTSLPKSDNSAVYYPWIKIPDPLNGGQPRLSAPCGAIAGIYARTDSSRGIWKAPAGTEATLTGVVGLDYTLTDPENGSLNPLGANCLRNFPVYGPVVWGARTLKGNDQMASEYKYVPIRRLAYYIEESLYRGLKWTVFEPNDEPLWAQIRLNAGAFMQNLFRQGAFQGQTRNEAYFVKCDKETTTQNDINLGIVNVWIGFAPLKPAEFVVLYIQQIAGQVQV
jgi:uncharacterized protein